MARALGDADLLAGQRLGANVLEIARLARDEARGRRVIARGEVRLLERFGGDADGGDGSVCVALVEARNEVFPGDGVHLALNLERLADGLGEIDVEAGEGTNLVVIMERRIVAVGDETQLGEPAHVGLGAEHIALPGIGNDFVLGRLGGCAMRLKDEQSADERGEPKRRRADADQSAGMEEASQHASLITRCGIGAKRLDNFGLYSDTY